LKSACYSYLEISKRLYGALTIKPVKGENYERRNY
jgi:hypothetical protein